VPSEHDLLLADLLSDQIAHLREFPERAARTASTATPLPEPIERRLGELGLDRLFTHQAAAYDEAVRGSDLMVVTGTNSGKTLCYNLPALRYCLTEPAARVLYLFPTKALAQDQLGKLEQLIPEPAIRCATYDGDTPKSRRSSIRSLSHLILTNPDMLHIGILPGHEHWGRFLKSLRLIVIDEMHVYRGVFGSHVGNVLRRLLRLCEWHRNTPQIIGCSATIGNPTELFQRLTSRRPVLIEDDGSPKGRRTFAFYNPPSLGEGVRLSANVATAEILAGLVDAQVRTLAFSRARVSAELVLKYARRRLQEENPKGAEQVESYRAGYTPKERRQIETSLFQGKLLGLSATNAMELGVDVGGLDAVVMNGYPGTIASFWQQAGRAGRGTRAGLAILVAHDDPLEQFLIRNPETLLGATHESVAVNPENNQILAQQLRCAAHERPLAPHEFALFGPTALDLAETLDRSGDLEFRSGLFFYPSHEAPAPAVDLRGSGGPQISLRIDGEELGSMERWRALQSAHEGAVYLHRGSTYLVRELNLEARQADVVSATVDYYTQSIVQSVIEPQVTLDEARVGDGSLWLGGVSVTDAVVGYRRKSLDGEAILGVEALDLPPQTYETLAVRFDLPAIDSDENPLEAMGGVHGLEHALMAIAPLVAASDRGDLGSAWYSLFPDTLAPAVYVFDRTPGGVGLCERLFDSVRGWIQAAHQLLASCSCEGGCPACLYSARCEASNETLDKAHTLHLLRRLGGGS
jgi:DEAD/DEAH box helicase domain-containing protein